MSRLFLEDPVSGETLDYDGLAGVVLADRLRYRPYCQPSRLSDAFFAIATALATDRDLTLVDDGLTERELADLGLSEALLRREEEVANPREARELESWLAAVRTDCRSRLTLFTSGSTGLPKGVNHTLATLSRGVRTGPKHACDVWGFAYNPTHMAGVQVFLQALFNLNPLVNLFRLPREEVLSLLGRHRVTHLSATPSFYRLLLPADTALPEVRAVTFGGERTDAPLLERLRPLFPNARFRNVYASTEAGTLFSAEGDLFSVPDGLVGRIEIRDRRLHLHRSLLGEFLTEAGQLPRTPVGRGVPTAPVAAWGQAALPRTRRSIPEADRRFMGRSGPWSVVPQLLIHSTSSRAMSSGEASLTRRVCRCCFGRLTLA